jgi:hypothetical protein
MRRAPLPLLLCPALLAGVAPPLRAAEQVSLSERTQGLARQEGFVSWYWDERQGQLLLEPRLGEELLYGAGLAGGAGILEASLDRGQLGELGLVRFERVGPRVLLRQLQTRHRSGVADPERGRVVAESFASSILAALPIVAADWSARARRRGSSAAGRFRATPSSRPTSPGRATSRAGRWRPCCPTGAA